MSLIGILRWGGEAWLVRAAQAEAFDPKLSGGVVRVAAGTGVLLRKERGEKGRSLERDPFLSFVSQSICVIPFQRHSQW